MTRTRRKPYTRSKRHDASCRSHGMCGYCVDNRTFTERRDAQPEAFDDEVETLPPDVARDVQKPPRTSRRWRKVNGRHR